MTMDGKTVLITGGNSGIGKETAVGLAKLGANVVFTSRDNAKGEAAAADIRRRVGREVAWMQLELASFEAIRRFAGDFLGRYPRLDVLVNNAGMNRDAVVWKMTDAEWDQVIDADLSAAFRYTRASVPIFREAGVGRIVNIASINGLRGKFGQSNYSAAKAGLIGFTKSIARELGAFNITANVVAPGLVEGDMSRAMPDEARQRSLAETVLGRLGTAEDVAAAVTFLAGPGAGHITGAVLQVDGGQDI